jgi:hypothetical protein
MDTLVGESARETATGAETAQRPHAGSGLTVNQILEWALEHRMATGRWPNRMAGRLPGENRFDTWLGVDLALCLGLRGLPGGQSLAGLLHQHGKLLASLWRESQRRGGQIRRDGPGVACRLVWTLSEDQILAWADAYHAKHGAWPVSVSGQVEGVRRLAWGTINHLLMHGGRGLPGGSSLADLLADRRGVHVRWRRGLLSVAQILAWADDYHAEHGMWPKSTSGAVRGAGRGECWFHVDTALRLGLRGMPGRSSLRGLLEEQRNVPSRTLTVEMIRTWMETHRAATGRWPNTCSGPIPGTSGESWSRVDSALRAGCRGLPGGSSLRRLCHDLAHDSGALMERPAPA